MTLYIYKNTFNFSSLFSFGEGGNEQLRERTDNKIKKFSKFQQLLGILRFGPE